MFLHWRWILAWLFTLFSGHHYDLNLLTCTPGWVWGSDDIDKPTVAVEVCQTNGTGMAASQRFCSWNRCW